MSAPPSGDHAVTITCPRCGYALSGLTSAFTEQCPLEGRCTECGLSIRWGDLFRLPRHPDLIEHTPRQTGAAEWVRRLRWTLLASLRPGHFYRTVRLEHAPRPLVMLALALPLPLLHWMTLVMFMFTVFMLPGPALSSPRDWIPAASVVSALLISDLSFMLIAPLVICAGAPLTFLMLPVTFRRIRIRRHHILRLWIYPLVTVTIAMLLWSIMICTLHALGAPRAAFVLNPVSTLEFAFRMPPNISSITWLTYLRGTAPGMALGAPVLLWFLICWQAGCSRYLRLPRASAVAITLTGVLALAAFTAQFIFVLNSPV